jgi:hypothetical protein
MEELAAVTVFGQGKLLLSESAFHSFFYFCGLSWRVRNAIVPKKSNTMKLKKTKFSIFIPLWFNFFPVVSCRGLKWRPQ